MLPAKWLGERLRRRSQPAAGAGGGTDSGVGPRVRRTWRQTVDVVPAVPVGRDLRARDGGNQSTRAPHHEMLGARCKPMNQMSPLRDQRAFRRRSRLTIRWHSPEKDIQSQTSHLAVLLPVTMTVPVDHVRQKPGSDLAWPYSLPSCGRLASRHHRQRPMSRVTVSPAAWWLAPVNAVSSVLGLCLIRGGVARSILAHCTQFRNSAGRTGRRRPKARGPRLAKRRGARRKHMIRISPVRDPPALGRRSRLAIRRHSPQCDSQSKFSLHAVLLSVATTAPAVGGGAVSTPYWCYAFVGGARQG